MDLTRHWLDAQKSTPSFVSNFNDIQDILDAPLPAALRSHSPRATSMGAGHRSQTPPPGGRSMSVHSNRYGGYNGAASGAAVTPGRKIHEELIEKGKLYEQRREALREKALREEQKKANQSRFRKDNLAKTPPASKEEQRRQKLEDEAERKKRFEKLWRDGKKKEEEDMYNRMKAEKAEKAALESYGFKPRISGKGRRTTSRVSLVEQQSNWQRRKEEELDRLRRERIVEEMAHVQDGPDISIRSQKIAMKVREREGLAGLSHIEAMLERDRLKKLARWEEAQRERMKESANPKITVHAAALPREGSVGDRLYAESFEMEERKAQRIRERLTEKHESFTPRITPYAASVRRDRPVEDELMFRHLEALAERDEQSRMQEERIIEQHVPAINPVSDAIASRLPFSARERLYQPRKTFVDPEPEQFSRTASTNSTNSTMSQSEREAARQARLEKDEQRRRERLEQLAAEKERKEMAECTFTPKTKHRTPTRTRGDAGDLYSRNEQWQKRKEMKLQEQAELRSKSELEGCTFHPHVEEHRSQERLRSIYGGDGTPWGVQEYLERQKEARRLQEERQERQQTNTESWRPGVTVPKEFRFTNPGDRAVRALERPVAPLPRDSSPPREYSSGHRFGAMNLPSPHHFSASGYGRNSEGRDNSVPPPPPPPEDSPRRPLVPYSVMEHRGGNIGGLSPQAASQRLRGSPARY